MSAYGRSECDEVADMMGAPDFETWGEAVRYVRERMPDENDIVISNVAWSLFTRDAQESNAA